MALGYSLERNDTEITVRLSGELDLSTVEAVRS